MLNDLEAVNGSMSPQFSPSILEYNVSVDEDVMSLILNYDAPIDATVTIHGNNYLTEGENHVLIEVYQNELVTYKLTVFKSSSETMSGIMNDYQKVEVMESRWYDNLITPGISIVCFLTIVILFCIIFKKR